jgi:hypothetical protein
MSVRLFARIGAASTGRILMKTYIGKFYKIFGGFPDVVNIGQRHHAFNM